MAICTHTSVRSGRINMTDFDQLSDLLSRHREVAILASLDIESDGKAIVAGAYEGTTIKFLCDFFGPELQVYGFEPQVTMYKRATRNLSAYPNVHLYNYGIGVESGSFPMVRGDTDQCSFVEDGTPVTNAGELLDANEIFADLGRVRLMVLNMEKYEHVLLPYMTRCDLMQYVDHLVVQFHGDEDDHAPSSDLLKSLRHTHDLKWSRPRWQWAYWARYGV